MNTERNYLFNTQGVDLFTIPNFLSSKECDFFCEKILENHVRSSVTGAGKELNVINESRTSSSSYMGKEHPVVVEIDQKISKVLNIPVSYGEDIQGQLYEIGQQFNDHRDYFSEDGFINNCLKSGQRTWTVMIYLNEVEEGGHTEFPEIGKSIMPQKGMAVCWKNSDGTGKEYPATMHAGKPVVKGRKMILTKWFREFPFQPHEDNRLALEHHNGHKTNTQNVNEHERDIQTEIPTMIEGTDVKLEWIDGIPYARYGTKENIPKFTVEGFKKMDIPFDLYNEIMVFYYQNRINETPEFDPLLKGHLNDVIQSKKVKYPSYMIQLDDSMRQRIFDGLHGVLAEWSGKKLQQTYCYGIRVYRRGAVLQKHTDRFETHIISAILNVDQRVDQPWPLQIEDHEGREHEVLLRPGEMVLYESATLIHGRIKPFQGDYFANIFTHFLNIS